MQEGKKRTNQRTNQFPTQPKSRVSRRWPCTDRMNQAATCPEAGRLTHSFRYYIYRHSQANASVPERAVAHIDICADIYYANINI